MRVPPSSARPRPTNEPASIRQGPASSQRKPPPDPKRWVWPVVAMLGVPLVIVVGLMVLIPRWNPFSFSLFSSASSTPERGSTQSKRSLLKVKVLDEDGDPEEGAKLTVIGPPTSYLLIKEGVTDVNGWHTFIDLPAVHVRVLAESPEEGVVAGAEIAVPAESTEELTLVLHPGRLVRGLVTDEENKPIQGALISAEGVPFVHRHVASAHDGAFKLPRLLAEVNAVKVIARGFATATVPLRRPADGNEEVVNVRLRKAPDIEGRVVTPDGEGIRASIVACQGVNPGEHVVSEADGSFKLPASVVGCPVVAHHDEYTSSEPVTVAANARVALKLLRGGSIRGRVVDETGRGIGSFMVGIESFSPAYSDRAFSVRSGPPRPFADPTGSFAYEKLAPGAYVLTVLVEGRPPVRSPSVEIASGRASDEIRIVVPMGLAVSGRVVDAQTREPLAGVTVAFDTMTSTRPPSGDPNTTTGEDGRFKLEGAPDGPFTLRFEHAGYRTRMLAGLRGSNRGPLENDVALTAMPDASVGIEFGGIGANLVQTREGIVLSSVFPGEPAARAGLLQGDRLRRVDGDLTEGLSVADAIQRLRGEPGTSVTLSVQRPGADAWIEVTLIRAAIVR